MFRQASVVCIVFLDVDPGREWLMVAAAVRDEFADRAWSPPAAHWPHSPGIVGPRDDTAGGTWLAVDESSPALALVVNRPFATRRSIAAASRATWSASPTNASSYAAHSPRARSAGRDSFMSIANAS
jgi:uncharacterized protein with NRDE domain